MPETFKPTTRWYHSFAAVMALPVAFCSAVLGIYANQPVYYVVGSLVSVALLLWATIDPYLNGHWKRLGREVGADFLNWAAKRSSWQRLGARLFVYGVPMFFRLVVPSLGPQAFMLGIAFALMAVVNVLVTDDLWKFGTFTIIGVSALVAVGPSLKWGCRIFESRLQREKTIHYPAFRHKLKARGL